MLGSGSGQIETILAGAEHLKKTIIVNGKSTEVPGYGTAMCIIFGLTTLFAIQFLLIGSECVPCSPQMILHRLTLLAGPRNHGSHFEARNATFEEGEVNGHTLSPRHLSLEEVKGPHFLATVKHLDLEIGKLWSPISRP
jgi:hypothetical protein